MFNKHTHRERDDSVLLISIGSVQDRFISCSFNIFLFPCYAVFLSCYDSLCLVMLSSNDPVCSNTDFCLTILSFDIPFCLVLLSSNDSVCSLLQSYCPLMILSVFLCCLPMILSVLMLSFCLFQCFPPFLFCPSVQLCSLIGSLDVSRYLICLSIFLFLTMFFYTSLFLISISTIFLLSCFINSASCLVRLSLCAKRTRSSIYEKDVYTTPVSHGRYVPTTTQKDFRQKFSFSVLDEYYDFFE